MKIEGYHNTKSENITSILQNGFKCRYNDKHWLGQGIYFFADYDIAILNLNMLEQNETIKTICVEIDVPDDQFIDFDIVENLNQLRIYCNEKENELQTLGKKILFKDTDPREARQKLKCFFLDLFKKEKGYAVVSKTFSKEDPPYGVKVKSIKYFGMPYLEKYICVANNEYIVKKNLIERELIV